MLFVSAGIIAFFNAEKFSFLDEFIQGIFSNLEGLKWISLISYILLNNIYAAFIAMLFGVLLGISVISAALVNGFVLGYVYNKVYNLSGFSGIIATS